MNTRAIIGRLKREVADSGIGLLIASLLIGPLLSLFTCNCAASSVCVAIKSCCTSQSTKCCGPEWRSDYRSCCAAQTSTDNKNSCGAIRVAITDGGCESECNQCPCCLSIEIPNNFFASEGESEHDPSPVGLGLLARVGSIYELVAASEHPTDVHWKPPLKLRLHAYLSVWRN